MVEFQYPLEVYYATTEDGYILELFRIPGGKGEKADPQAKRKQPIILQHGLTSCSIDWVLAGPRRALGRCLKFPHSILTSWHL